jgi:hypothetical protein
MVGVLALAAAFLYLSNQMLNEQRQGELISLTESALSQVAAQHARAEAGEISDGTGTNHRDGYHPRHPLPRDRILSSSTI